MAIWHSPRAAPVPRMAKRRFWFPLRGSFCALGVCFRHATWTDASSSSSAGFFCNSPKPRVRLGVGWREDLSLAVGTAHRKRDNPCARRPRCIGWTDCRDQSASRYHGDRLQGPRRDCWLLEQPRAYLFARIASFRKSILRTNHLATSRDADAVGIHFRL